MNGDAAVSRSLRLTVTPLARRGDSIVAIIEATNVSETLLQLSAPDTVVVSPPSHQAIGSGSFKVRREWTIEHVQPGRIAIIEITATAGGMTQTALCRVAD